MYCPASATRTGSFPSFNTFATEMPTGTVQTSSPSAFQLASTFPEYPTLQPSGRKYDAMGCRFIWLVAGRLSLPAMDIHC